MSTGWVFVFACIAFSCNGQQARPGNGEYYETKLACHTAALDHASRRAIRPNRWEPICVERERPQ